MDRTVDFGVYHHSNREESEKLRKKIASLFNRSVAELKTWSGSEKFTKGLDAGCGSGFVSHLLHEGFQDMHIWAVDNFKDTSLENNSMEKTVSNFQRLGMIDAVTLVKADLRKIPLDDCYFNLAASSLVYHNLGCDFFQGMEEIHRVLEKDGIFLYGDIFTENRMEQIMKLFNVKNTLKLEGVKEYSILMLTKK